MNNIVALLLIIACLGAGGCSWMGETAGRAKASVERGVEDLQDGYHDGYSSGKGGGAKNASSTGTAKDSNTKTPPAEQPAPQ